MNLLPQQAEKCLYWQLKNNMNKEQSFQEKYNAIGKKETTSNGLFVTAVITTGIFCLPSCRAKKPKAENVVFYTTPQEALQHGFRPCKICKPMEPKGNCPAAVQQLIAELHQNPFVKIKDFDLRKRNIEPSFIRRWFKNNHAITFHAYQRMLRLNSAYKQLKNGSSVTSTAFDTGYESLSGFGASYKNIFSEPPSKSTNKNVINITRFSTKLGAMFACATEQGLCLLEFTDRKMLEWEFKDLCKRFDALILPGENKFLLQIEKEANEYLDGKRKKFTVPLLPSGTEFQQSVWKILQQITFGSTISYQELANKMNNPKATRAVATANGYNKIAFAIPCHRVIGSDGHLTGYGGGLGRKKFLIELEQSCF